MSINFPQEVPQAQLILSTHKCGLKPDLFLTCIQPGEITQQSWCRRSRRICNVPSDKIPGSRCLFWMVGMPDLSTNSRWWTNAVLMLAHRRRRWASIKTALFQHLLFAVSSGPGCQAVSSIRPFITCLLISCWRNLSYLDMSHYTSVVVKSLQKPSVHW